MARLLIAMFILAVLAMQGCTRSPVASVATLNPLNNQAALTISIEPFAQRLRQFYRLGGIDAVAQVLPEAPDLSLLIFLHGAANGQDQAWAKAIAQAWSVAYGDQALEHSLRFVQQHGQMARLGKLSQAWVAHDQGRYTQAYHLLRQFTEPPKADPLWDGLAAVLAHYLGNDVAASRRDMREGNVESPIYHPLVLQWLQMDQQLTTSVQGSFGILLRPSLWRLSHRSHQLPKAAVPPAEASLALVEDLLNAAYPVVALAMVSPLRHDQHLDQDSIIQLEVRCLLAQDIPNLWQQALLRSMAISHPGIAAVTQAQVLERIGRGTAAFTALEEFQRWWDQRNGDDEADQRLVVMVALMTTRFHLLNNQPSRARDQLLWLNDYAQAASFSQLAVAEIFAVLAENPDAEQQKRLLRRLHVSLQRRGQWPVLMAYEALFADAWHDPRESDHPNPPR
ncbi:MAG: hypothetical protein EA401_13040 [Planctomycetota bacterium]|nr:MAG: hypothetical protein EA401_13040 [Planctomycetota bacterium]